MKFATFVNKETGEILMEAFGPPNARLDGDSLSEAIYALSETLIRGWKPEKRGGFFGGDFGYGVDYENDVFLMHPDYQDSKCKCGHDRARRRMEKQHIHSEDCFTSIVQRKLALWPEPCLINCSSRWDLEEKMVLRLGESFGLQKANQWDCTCGVDQKRRAWFDEHPHDFRCPIVLPQFWYKPTNLKVDWYKYIGRDMEPSSPLNSDQFREIFLTCWESIPEEIRAAALRDEKEEQANRPSEEERRVLDGHMFAVIERVMQSDTLCWRCSKAGPLARIGGMFSSGPHGCVAKTCKDKRDRCRNCGRVTTPLQARILMEREKRNNAGMFKDRVSIGDKLPI